MHARIAGTLVDISFAVDASVPRTALTQVVIDLVIASCSVLAWVRFALINFSFAVDSRETRETFAFVLVLSINAFSVDTRIGQTFINVSLAMLSSVSRRADTFVFIDFVDTGRPRWTWVGGTLVNITVAIDAGPSRVAVAEVVVDVVFTISIDAGF